MTLLNVRGSHAFFLVLLGVRLQGVPDQGCPGPGKAALSPCKERKRGYTWGRTVCGQSSLAIPGVPPRTVLWFAPPCYPFSANTRTRFDRMTAFLQGFSLGLAYVAPIGLQNLFVINSALSRPRSVALRIAGIVIVFDVLLSLAGFFGVGALITRSELARVLILGAGSLLVLVIGARLVLSRSVASTGCALDMPLWRVAWMAFAVTWLNPQALLDVSLLLGAFRAVLAESETTAFILGVTTASCSWFTGLTLVVSCLKSRFTARILRLINLVCGLVICGYALHLGWSLVGLLRS